MTGDDGRALLELEHLPQPRHVLGEGAHRKLGCSHPEAGRLQRLDDLTPAGSVRPGAVDEHDVGATIHFATPFMGGQRAHSRWLPDPRRWGTTAASHEPAI